MKIVISGGGTAGHVCPAIALASALSARPEAPEIVFIGTPAGAEASLVPAAGFTLREIDARGVDRSMKGLAAIIPLAKGFFESRRILAQERPDVVVGMGGFVSAPVLLAARARRTPYVLHEQNSLPGLVNRAFARRACAVCLTFPGSAKHLTGARTIVTGNPVRDPIRHPSTRERACVAFGFDPDEPVLLAFGGSRGAQRINRALVEAQPLWRAGSGLQILHVAGKIEYEETRAALATQEAGAGRPLHRLVPYIDDMTDAYSCADLVLSRAGATTIAELTAAGVPSALVPYPYATGDHQAKNAAALSEAGAAVVIEDAALDGAELVRVVEELMGDPQRLASMATAAREWGTPEAAEALAAEVIRAATG